MISTVWHRSIAISAYASVIALSVFLAPHRASADIAYDVSSVAPTSFPGPYSAPVDAPHSSGGDGLGYPGDSVGMAGYSSPGSVLGVGTSVQQINTMNWSVSYTYNSPDGYIGTSEPPDGSWPELDFPFTLTESIYFDGVLAGTISQTGLLRSTWDNDYLSLNAGSTSTFFVPGFQIDVTPLAVAETGASNFDGDPPWNQPDQAVMAEFVVSAATVPEPGSVLIWGLIVTGGGLGSYMRRRRAASRAR